MLIVEDASQIPSSLSYPVLSIGAFDGLHRGHQAIMSRLLELKAEHQGTAIVLTFKPHPRRVINPATAPPLLQTREQKEELLRQMGIDILYRLPFSRELSLLSPERFVNDVLLRCPIREIVIGANFRFGHQRAGDVATLGRLCAPYGVKVHGIEPLVFRNERISSTRVRELLESGRVALARRILGRPYQMRGTIVRGAGNGRRLGFPTANLEPDNELRLPVGVYAGRARVESYECVCVVNIGFRPTVHQKVEGSPVIEAHLLDFEGDIYGSALSLDFCVRLRGERKFDSLDALKKQIAKDIRLTRQYVARLRGEGVRDASLNG